MAISRADLPSATSVYKLVRDAPGPSPWWCHQPIGSSRGQLAWRKIQTPQTVNLLISPDGEPILALPMYVWFRPLDDDWLLLWSKQKVSERFAPITIQLINLKHLRPLADVDLWLNEKPPHSVPYFSIDQEYLEAAEVSPAYPPGEHKLILPPKFAHVPEFFLISDNPSLPQKPGAASCCIYAINPELQIVEVLPQDWFNEGGLDYGYQWITTVTRDPATRRLLVSGFRIDICVLDKSGREVAQRLSPHLAH